MITAKFGGTSVANVDAITRLVNIVRANTEVGVVVVSALAGVTDVLIAMTDAAAEGDQAAALGLLSDVGKRHDALSTFFAVDARTGCALQADLAQLEQLVLAIAVVRDVSPTQRDAIMATGELLSSRVVTAALAHAGVPAVWIDARDVVVTDGLHTRAAPIRELTDARLASVVQPHLDEGRVAVVGGFVGATADGITTTLGRGGSDYSASIIGAGLGAKEIHIWTDVDGMLTADPRVVANGQVVPHLSFAEASELAYFGAKVLHPSTIVPAMARNIPVRILNSHRPDVPGTLITAKAPPSALPLRALACKGNVTIVDIVSTRMLMAYGFLQRVFEVFERHRTVVDVVTTSEVSVSVTIDNERSLDAVVTDLGSFADVSVERGFALVCAVGDRLRSDFTLCASILHALEGLPVRMVSQAASRHNITFVVAQRDQRAAMMRLHRAFFEDPAAAEGKRVGRARGAAS